MQPWWVHVEVNALKVPELGWVTTAPPTILPPPTGTSALATLVPEPPRRPPLSRTRPPSSGPALTWPARRRRCRPGGRGRARGGAAARGQGRGRCCDRSHRTCSPQHRAPRDVLAHAHSVPVVGEVYVTCQGSSVCRVPATRATVPPGSHEPLLRSRLWGSQAPDVRPVGTPRGSGARTAYLEISVHLDPSPPQGHNDQGTNGVESSGFRALASRVPGSFADVAGSGDAPDSNHRRTCAAAFHYPIWRTARGDGACRGRMRQPQRHVVVDGERRRHQDRQDRGDRAALR